MSDADGYECLSDDDMIKALQSDAPLSEQVIRNLKSRTSAYDGEDWSAELCLAVIERLIRKR